MAPKNPHRPFTPDPEQTALAPETSGNQINGLGENTPRRPRMVYWAPDPGDIPHGALQGYFYHRSAEVSAFGDMRRARQKIAEAPLPPLVPTPRQQTPQQWTGALRQFIDAGDCEMTGVAKMNPDWVYQGHTIAQSHVIMLGLQHDYHRLSTAPAPEAGLEVVTQYTRAAAVAKKLAGWIRTQGWAAEPVTGPLTGALAMIPPALACGFGELGKHGSLINPELGASFRLSAVLTDAPFAPTPPRSFGIDEFCSHCRICEDACPPEALVPEKQTVRGARKWYVNFDKCLPYFNQTHGCAICIAVCPWSRPGIGLNLAAKLARRAARSS